jgi:hypothetical protein
MGQINELELQFTKALDRIRAAVASPGGRAGEGDDEAPEPLRQKVASLENDKAKLLDELVSIRAKRDKDVAALDDLISQLKPLIEEASDA